VLESDFTDTPLELFQVKKNIFGSKRYYIARYSIRAIIRPKIVNFEFWMNGRRYGMREVPLDTNPRYL
jgi:hypothetical protein